MDCISGNIQVQGIMRDSFGRKIDYMRISVTDRCNLKCTYCMPGEHDRAEDKGLLTFDEIGEICGAAAELGISAFKITGGEPLIRKGTPELIRKIKKLPGVESVTLTTNGVLLSAQASELKAAGTDCINVSLDTAERERFAQITGTDAFDAVIDGIRAAIKAGIKVKINTLLQDKGEWKPLIGLADRLGTDIRFIERMPIGYGRAGEAVDNKYLLGELMKLFPGTEKDETVRGRGPAVYYRVPGISIAAGFISAVHGKFCGSCNRIRLSATGKIKPCLCYDSDMDLRSIIRNGIYQGEAASERKEAVKALITEAVMRKPKEHCFETPDRVTEEGNMISIGG